MAEERDLVTQGRFSAYVTFIMRPEGYKGINHLEDQEGKLQHSIEVLRQELLAHLRTRKKANATGAY